MKLRIPIGIDDFRALREQGLEYVDKSHLVLELLDKGAQVVLLPRPRRFGKSLNLSMLRCFFEKRAEDFAALFQDLAVWGAGEAYRAHFQRYPVIHLTFKGIKTTGWEDAWQAIRAKIEILFDEHRYLLDSGALSEREAAEYREMLARNAARNVYERALLTLAGHLHRHHGEKVVILIDEYDEPIHAAYLHGYASEALGFFRTFLTEGLKGNPHLFKAVLTGILRIAKESIFSGLNNLAVYTVIATEFNTCFGFTEPEVASLLERAGRAELMEGVRTWYDGYVFGGRVIYNPWSILSFLDREDKLLRGYWIGTSANDLVREQLQRHALAIEPEIEALLEGGRIERRLQENVVLGDLDRSVDVLFGLLVFSGYLKAEAGEGVPGEEPPYLLSIPNREVREVYASTFRDWMRDRLGGGQQDVRRLTTALLDGDAETVEEQIQAFATNLLSYHDTALRPEQVLHAFVIGLLAVLEPGYEVRSNRESGKGRPDVTIRPRAPGKPGVVLELKVAKPGRKTPETALAEAIAQIRQRDYAAELRAGGASPVHAFAVAFDGKSVHVRLASDAPPEGG